MCVIDFFTFVFSDYFSSIPPICDNWKRFFVSSDWSFLLCQCTTTVSSSNSSRIRVNKWRLLPVRKGDRVPSSSNRSKVFSHGNIFHFFLSINNSILKSFIRPSFYSGPIRGGASGNGAGNGVAPRQAAPVGGGGSSGQAQQQGPSTVSISAGGDVNSGNRPAEGSQEGNWRANLNLPAKDLRCRTEVSIDWLIWWLDWSIDWLDEWLDWLID